MDAYSALTTLGTLLLLAALASAVYVWLSYSRWSELRFRKREERLRAHEVVGALGRSGDPASDRARARFLRAVALFTGLVVLGVVMLEARELV